MPKATIQFGSPNACNICHADKSSQWANAHVQKRENCNYQDSTIYWAQLIKEARNNNWERLDEMLKIIEKNEYNEVVTASLIRLLGNNPQNEEVLIKSLHNPSPLVRAAAATALEQFSTEQTKNALLQVVEDSIRLVRIFVANSLSHYSAKSFTQEKQEAVNRATKEYLTSLAARPDDWNSHYNMALFHQKQGNVDKALGSYETATRLYPQSVTSLINSSLLYSYVGNNKKAEENLRKALSFDAENEAANINLGLLMAEKGNWLEAKKMFEQALKINPQQAVAAYNLSVIVAKKDLNKAINYATIATNANKEEPKYAYTLAFYQHKNNYLDKAKKTLETLIPKHPDYFNAYKLLLNIYTEGKNINTAKQVCRKALSQQEISKSEKRYFQEQLIQLTSLNY